MISKRGAREDAVKSLVLVELGFRGAAVDGGDVCHVLHVGQPKGAKHECFCRGLSRTKHTVDRESPLRKRCTFVNVLP